MPASSHDMATSSCHIARLQPLCSLYSFSLAAMLLIGATRGALCHIESGRSGAAADQCVQESSGGPALGAATAATGKAAAAQDAQGPTFTLLLNGKVFTPEALGVKNVLLAGGTIAAILDPEEMPPANLSGLPIEVIDAAGHVVVPGFVDIHEHITGGGGEAGPASRTPEALLSEIIAAGVTTVVGTLGTDCVSRSLENLRAKVAALEADGLSAYMWVGCYRMPSPTLTGSLPRDMALVHQVVGAGEVAVSDHRGSWPSTAALLALAADARVGGMLSGKRGVLHLHVGDAPSLLGPLWAVMDASAGALPMAHLLPTHVSLRGPALLRDAERWVRQGGNVDFTGDQAGENATLAALLEWGRAGVPLSHVSLSSDAFGSLPEYDGAGRLVRYSAFSPASLLRTVRALVASHGWPLPAALQLVTHNPAHFLGLPVAGRLAPGLAGDVLVLREADLELRWSFARGKKVLAPGWVKKGMFEK